MAGIRQPLANTLHRCGSQPRRDDQKRVLASAASQQRNERAGSVVVGENRMRVARFNTRLPPQPGGSIRRLAMLPQPRGTQLPMT
jgi:hypothetical protein